MAVNGNTARTGDQIQITLSDGTSSNFLGGVGVSSYNPLSYFTITPTIAGDGVFLYEVQSANTSLSAPGGSGGTGADTPEAATLALVGGGTLVLFGVRRKTIPKLVF